MSVPDRPVPFRSPRLVLVLAGACAQIGTPSTALERARMPNLTAVAASGRVGRLRTVAAHLPVTETTAAAALLGTIPPIALDPGAVAAESLGRLLERDERCTVIEVIDLMGEPAPALDVQRAVGVLRHQLTRHRVVGIEAGHRVLVAGPSQPVLPQLDGLDLRAAEHGHLPARGLGDDTVVIAAEGSTLLGVASILGARAIAVDPRRADRRDPVPARLRSQAIAALMAGAATVVVESQAPIAVRRGHRPVVVRDHGVQRVLEALDRELVGPLGSAAAWTGADLSITTDLPCAADGSPLRGEVPITMTGPRSASPADRPPLQPPPGTSFPPAYCERSVARLPIVSSPFALIPAPTEVGPRRFTRDPRTGRTASDELLVG